MNPMRFAIQRFLSRAQWIVFAGQKYQKSDLLKQYSQIRSLLQKNINQTVGIVTKNPLQMMLFYLVSQELEISLAILPSFETKFLSQVKLNAYVKDGTVINLENHTSNSNSGLTIFTSGSSGTPKAVFWSYEELHSQVTLQSHSGHEVVVSAYPCDTFAGLEAMLHILFRSDRSYFLESNEFLSSILIDEDKVDLVMGPPTFWRKQTLFDDKIGKFSCKTFVSVISMGGEPIDSATLIRLREIFAKTKIAQIYALSEVGSIFAVTDGHPGFPTSYLNRKLKSGVILKEINGELVVFSKKYPEGYHTLDLISRQADRCVFSGRNSDILNIAGRKILPQEIESKLMDIPGIKDIIVYSVYNPISGQLLAADIVKEDNSDLEAIKDKIVEKLELLDLSYFRPRRFREVSEISLNRAAKRQRQLGKEDA